MFELGVDWLFMQRRLIDLSWSTVNELLFSYFLTPTFFHPLTQKTCEFHEIFENDSKTIVILPVYKPQHWENRSST